MNAFVLSPSAMGVNTAGDYLPIIEKYHVAIINRYDNTFESIRKGDLVIIARGANWQKEVYFAGIVNSDESYSFSQDGVVLGDYARDLVDFIDLRGCSSEIPFNTDCTWGASKNPGAIYALKDDNPSDRAVITSVLQKIAKEKHNTEMK